MRLRSAELFFWQIESHLWESYSKYLLILIRQAHKNRKLVYFILGKLERLSYLTPKSHLNFLYALAICWGTENLPPSNAQPLNNGISFFKTNGWICVNRRHKNRSILIIF